MKWYWILLIALAAFAFGMIVSAAVKPKAKTTSNIKEGEPVKTTTDTTKVVTGATTDIVTKENPDGTKTTTVLTK